jgi:LysR family transcriptional regulator, glycine cleavage system transcriptional activator
MSFMDLDSLRCFDAVATTLSFRAAAARVHLSPAAFSDRIRRLEDDLGQTLLVRTTRKVALSDHGRRLLPMVREVLAGVARLRVADLADPGPSPFELVLGTRYELGLSWLCPSLAVLERARPERTIHLYNGDTPDLRLRLDRGELDAVVGSMRLTSAGLEYATLHDEDYVFVGRDARVRGPADARPLTLVDVTPDLPLFRYLLDALPGGEPWPFRRVEYLGGIAAIRRRLFDGGGRVAVLPTYFLRDDLRARRLARLLPRVRPRADVFRLVWRAGHPRADELRGLARELRAIPLR